MTNIAIQTNALSKQYRIGGPQKHYDRLGEQLVDIAKGPLRRARKLLHGQATGAAELDEAIWALKDVSLQIRRGEVVGVVGRNGAGKSTLLKVLSRITEPTAGEATIYGRVGSLLEVGTGFHPELTGRENVYLNGAILGMKKDEIAAKFDQIVSFAELHQFIETPVKHYSSGMYVRLAFSVAAHLEPEILLVDEVLAVGDVAFQKKCLGRMEDVAQEGRTVLFVSHNLGLLRALCQRGILLENGSLVVDDHIERAVNTYLDMLEAHGGESLSQRTDRSGEGQIRLVAVHITSGGSPVLRTGSPARFVFEVDGILPDIACSFKLYDSLGQSITAFKSSTSGPQDFSDPHGGQRFVCEIDELLLMPGRYRLDISIVGDDKLQDFVRAATFCDVVEGDVNGRPVPLAERGKKPDFRVFMPHRWILPPFRS